MRIQSNENSVTNMNEELTTEHERPSYLMIRRSNSQKQMTHLAGIESIRSHFRD
jgi:hypothetical protein